jgi:ketosteroid isomerase-like protein
VENPVEDAARRWAKAWATAWPRGDADAIAALYVNDAAYRALAFREPDSPTDYLRRSFAEESDVVCRFAEPVVSGGRAAIEWWGSWVEDGKELTLAGVTLLTFDDEGKVIDHRDYWNQAPGRVEPYPGW